MLKCGGQLIEEEMVLGEFNWSKRLESSALTRNNAIAYPTIVNPKEIPRQG
jgi:hypothetical protein